MGLTEKAQDWPGGARLEAGDREARQQVVAGGEADHAGVEIAEGDAPFHRHGPETFAAPRLAEQHRGVARVDVKALARRRLDDRHAQLAKPRHRVLGRGRDLGMPLVLEILDAEQIGAGLAEQPLERRQRAQIDIARMQLDLGDQTIEHLKFHKAEVPDGEADRVVIGVGIAQRGVKFLAIRQHPFAVGGNQHRQLLHSTSATPGAMPTTKSPDARHLALRG